MATYLFDGTNSKVDVDEYISNLATGNVDPVLYGFDENKNKIELTDLIWELYDNSYLSWTSYTLGGMAQATSFYNTFSESLTDLRRCRLFTEAGEEVEKVKYVNCFSVSEVRVTGAVLTSTLYAVAFYDENKELLRVDDLGTSYWANRDVGFSIAILTIDDLYEMGATLADISNLMGYVTTYLMDTCVIYIAP